MKPREMARHYLKLAIDALFLYPDSDGTMFALEHIIAATRWVETAQSLEERTKI